MVSLAVRSTHCEGHRGMAFVIGPPEGAADPVPTSPASAT
ncbi:MAG: hypothetical protein JWQ81_367 [Amycolatopsis sp.]|nr:hypothetical protein [Amycolatopsis sp.]